MLSSAPTGPSSLTLCPSKSQVQLMPSAMPGPCRHLPSLAGAAALQSHGLWRCQRANATPELPGFSPTPDAQAEMLTCHQPAENYPQQSHCRCSPRATPAAHWPPTPRHLQSSSAGRHRQVATAAPESRVARHGRGPGHVLAGTAHQPSPDGTATLPCSTSLPVQPHRPAGLQEPQSSAHAEPEHRPQLAA